MTSSTRDVLMRMAAFEHVQSLQQVHDHLTTNELKPGFVFEGNRIPLVNPQRGIFKPQQMQFLLSIKTVFPRPGRRIWYDDQRDIHRHVFGSDETVEYAFMGQDPDAADNRWLREAFENQIPVIYFLGIAPGRYQAVLPAFISGCEPRPRWIKDLSRSTLSLHSPGAPWNDAMRCKVSSAAYIRHRSGRPL